MELDGHEYIDIDDRYWDKQDMGCGIWRFMH